MRGRLRREKESFDVADGVMPDAANGNCKCS